MGLGVGMMALQFVTGVEALLTELITRFRWLRFKRGKNAIGLLSLMLLAFALPGFQNVTAVTPEGVGEMLLYFLYLILPVIPDWGLLYFRRVSIPADQ